jgi:hypothetical protein
MEPYIIIELMNFCNRNHKKNNLSTWRIFKRKGKIKLLDPQYK